MEELAAFDTNTTNKQESHSIQTRLRKHFQKNRPFLGSKEQKGDSKKETAGRVQLKSKRRHVLDRVFSSSQPNLCCSGPNDNTGSGGQRDSRAGNKLLSEPKAATPQKQKAIFASVWSAVTHHKSSSECLKVPNRAEEVQSCSQPQAAVTLQHLEDSWRFLVVVNQLGAVLTLNLSHVLPAAVVKHVRH
ncbi:uncharacterized protein zgc:194908 isoform X1 [Chiloscyllium plagiosum]|uniref:uncharacterized protein zgc:194908 isoform X1 n=1 Tax=Chiloscyllium plagiosum TaxID=36176 RepID=UPI001CB81E92|nr:uncharacterized protein zgc:194908 isoform X1 [Chiloscyllium plagiosum]